MLIRNQFYHIFVIFVILSIGILYFGCATTAQPTYTESSSEDVADIDQLLGLDDEEETIKEDDVLRLLGVMEDQPEEDAESESSLKAFEESGSDVESQPSGSSAVDWFGDSESTPSPTSALATTEPVKPTPTESKSISYDHSGSYQTRYERARQDYNTRKYKEAIQQFEMLLEENNSHSLSDNCQYWIGESYYGMGNYQMAIAAFQKVFAFPKSNKLADSQLKIGFSYFKMNQKSRAKDELQKMVDNYPSSQYVSTARRLISQIDQELAP